jgi:hypothetical protein
MTNYTDTTGPLLLQSTAVQPRSPWDRPPNRKAVSHMTPTRPWVNTILEGGVKFGSRAGCKNGKGNLGVVEEGFMIGFS